MKRLTLLQLFNLYALIFPLLFTSTTRLLADLNLPKNTSIMIGKQKIIGFRGKVENIREIAKELTSDENEPDSSVNLIAEGFVYNEDFGIKEVLSVSAWSSSGRGDVILKEAKAHLERIIQSTKIADNDEPGGYLYAGEATENYVKKSPRAIKGKIKYKSKNLIAKANSPLNVQENFNLTPSVDTEKLKTMNSSWGELTSGIWNWALLILLLLILLLVVTRKVLKKHS